MKPQTKWHILAQDAPPRYTRVEVSFDGNVVAVGQFDLFGFDFFENPYNLERSEIRLWREIQEED